MTRFLLFLSFALVLGSAVFADRVRSSESEARKVILTGKVYDTNHAVIIFSEVVAQSETRVYKTMTSEEGYKFELPPARYSIEANAAGFCPRHVDLFRVVNSARQRPLDFVLEVKDNDRPCKQKTRLRKEPLERRPEDFRRIAE